MSSYQSTIDSESDSTARKYVERSKKAISLRRASRKIKVEKIFKI